MAEAIGPATEATPGPKAARLGVDSWAALLMKPCGSAMRFRCERDWQR